MEELKAAIDENGLMALVTAVGIRVGIALAIFIIGRWISKWLVSRLRKFFNRKDYEETLEDFLCNITYAALLAIVILAALDALGIPATSALAIFGAAGLAIGLALKDSLGNFAAGVMIIMFRPFGKEDYVEVAGVSGSVDEVRVFSTNLITPDNKVVVIPNGQIMANPITNYSALEQRRVDLVIGVGYNDDLRVARDVLEGILRDHPLVLDDPEFVVAVTELGDNSVNFNVRPWVNTDDYWGVRSDVLEQAKVKLEAAGCSIPYPQRDMHVYTHDSGSDTDS